GVDAPTSNFAGRVGAFLAELTFQLVGYTAFVVPGALIVPGWNYFWGRKVDAPATKVFGACLLFGCVSTFMSMAVHPTGTAGMASHSRRGYLRIFLSAAKCQDLGQTRS